MLTTAKPNATSTINYGRYNPSDDGSSITSNINDEQAGAGSRKREGESTGKGNKGKSILASSSSSQSWKGLSAASLAARSSQENLYDHNNVVCFFLKKWKPFILICLIFQYIFEGFLVFFINLFFVYLLFAALLQFFSNFDLPLRFC